MLFVLYGLYQIKKHLYEYFQRYSCDVSTCTHYLNTVWYEVLGMKYLLSVLIHVHNTAFVLKLVVVL